MATRTINVTSSTYVTEMNKTADNSHSGLHSPNTTWILKGRPYDQTRDNTYREAAILRFNRPNDLRYAKITEATLTWSVEGFANKGFPDYSERVMNMAYIATYTTDRNLSEINFLNYETAGVVGTWVTIQGTPMSSSPSPLTRTTNITSLYSGDLSREDITLIISAGNACILNGVMFKNLSWISSAYLTITYEQGTQPDPKPLYPRDITIIEADTTLFSWQFNSEVAAVQKTATLEWKNVEDVSYTVVNLTQSATTYTLEEHLPVGSYQWRVKVTNDADMPSGYSEVAYFSIIGRPSAPIINEPDNKALTTITWSTIDQQSFEIILQDQAGNQLIHESIALPEAEYRPNIFLKGNYLVSVRVMNSSQMWSEWSQRAFTISATGPDLATFTIISAAGNPAIRVAYALPEGTQAVLVRSENGVEKILAQLEDLEGEFADDTAASDVEYQYFVRTYEDGYTDTAPRSATLRFEGAVLKANGEYLHLKYSNEPFLPYQEIREREYAAMNFSGREYAVVERGEHTNVEFTRKFFVALQDKPKLDDLCNQEEVFYRDSKKNAFPVAITRVQYDGFQSDGYILTIYFIRIHEEEVVVNV